MEAVNGSFCELLGRLLCILIDYIMIDNENSTNLSADSLQVPQIHIVWGFLSGPRHRQWDHVLLFLIFFNSRGRVPLAGNSLRAEKSHWQVQKVTLAGPKSHTRAKMSHWSVIICNKNFKARR